MNEVTAQMLAGVLRDVQSARRAYMKQGSSATRAVFLRSVIALETALEIIIGVQTIDSITPPAGSTDARA